MKADVHKVSKYKSLALFGKNKRIRKKNMKRWISCYDFELVPYKIAEGIIIYKREIRLKEI